MSETAGRNTDGLTHPDPYEVLGLERGASAVEIKRAYRRLARQYHPDAAKDGGGGERFKELSEAFRVLGDAELRARYDAHPRYYRRTGRLAERAAVNLPEQDPEECFTRGPTRWARYGDWFAREMAEAAAARERKRGKKPRT